MNAKKELLSPAKDTETAKAAILAGADAVYIGANAFGARAAAANSTQDIAALCRFAHIYGCKVYVALNTILFDTEVAPAIKLAWEIYEAGADALIVQDLGLLEASAPALPPIPLHASTQCHLDSPEKARFLEAAGFDTIVVARELSLAEIAEISKAANARIECFVHGALCVSYSGQCYLSHAIGGRSGNRGECAQPCRMQYAVLNADGSQILPPAHYLSLRDMNRLNSVGELIDAGVDIFKIEGRLKDVGYVKNITALYRAKLDAELEKRGLQKSSYGKSQAGFTPSAQKSFSRLFTEYHLHGTQGGSASFETPKARGQYIGEVRKSFAGGFFFENAEAVFANGDGLMFEFNGMAAGASVRKAEGEKVYIGHPEERLQIPQGAKIWRNKDAAFEKELKAEPVRKMAVAISADEGDGKFLFRIKTLDDRNASAEVEIADAEIAQNAEVATQKLKENLSKLGQSPFYAAQVSLDLQSIPHLKAAEINALRRALVEKLEADILQKYDAERSKYVRRQPKKIEYAKKPFETDYRANVLNESARKFYGRMGFEITAKAPESGESDLRRIKAMTTKHCILRELGMCKKSAPLPKDFKEPLFLLGGNAKLRLSFDCARCGMDIFYEKA